MGGSAAVVSAFEAAVLGGFGQNLHALLCLGRALRESFKPG